jgi:hypothetical protein
MTAMPRHELRKLPIILLLAVATSEFERDGRRAANAGAALSTGYSPDDEPSSGTLPELYPRTKDFSAAQSKALGSGRLPSLSGRIENGNPSESKMLLHL